MAKDRYKKLLEDWEEDSSWVSPKSSDDGAYDAYDDFGSDDLGGEELESGADGAWEPDDRHEKKAKFRSRQLERPPSHKMGTVICLDEEELVVYRGPARGQSYDMVYALLADGTAKLEGCQLGEHEKFEMGCLPGDLFKRLRDHKRWTRQIIVESLFDPADGEIIPEPETADSLADQLLFSDPTPEPSRPTEAPEEPEERGSLIVPTREASLGREMRRGQVIRLKFGSNKWEAVYWGRDANGTVIAHRTNNNWELMHFDLAPYKRKIEIEEKVDRRLVEEIMKST